MIGIQKDRFTRCSAGLSPTKIPDSVDTAIAGTMLYAVI